MLRKSTLPGCCLWTGWSCLHCPQGLTLLSMDRGKKKSQAAHCAPGGTPSLPSVLCACGSSSSFPSNIAMLLNQGIPKLMYTQLGERRGRECHFALSSPSITLQAWIAGDWGVTDKAGRGLEEQSSKTGQDCWGWDEVELILGLGGWLDLMVKWLHVHGREHFAFISSNFNTTLKHRERSKFYFPWSKTKCLGAKQVLSPARTELPVL